METPNFEPLGQDPTPEMPESPQNRTEKPESGSGFIAWLKNSLVFILLAVIVIASFWVSFQLGKRLLVPVKKVPERKIEAAIPEPPPSLKALIKAMSEEAKTAKAKKPKLALSLPPVAVPHLTTATVAAAPIVTKQITETRKPARKEAKIASAGHYYKVQAAVFRNKANAETLANKIKAAGFDIFVKKVSSGWRVQVGAFRTRTEAEALQTTLQKKSYKAIVLYE